MLVKIPSWAKEIILEQAGIQAIMMIHENEFQRITQKELQILQNLVLKRINKKLKSKDDVWNLIESIEFDQIVYQELGTIYQKAY